MAAFASLPLNFDITATDAQLFFICSTFKQFEFVCRGEKEFDVVAVRATTGGLPGDRQVVKTSRHYPYNSCCCDS